MAGRFWSFQLWQITQVIDYIKNQELHHQKRTFLEEFKDFLEKFEVDFDQRFIFQEVKYGNEKG